MDWAEQEAEEICFHCLSPFWRDDVFNNEEDNKKEGENKTSAKKGRNGISHILSILTPTMREMNVTDSSMCERSTTLINFYYESKCSEL